jgi:hypothetical protein
MGYTRPLPAGFEYIVPLIGEPYYSPDPYEDYPTLLPSAKILPKVKVTVPVKKPVPATAPAPIYFQATTSPFLFNKPTLQGDESTQVEFNWLALILLALGGYWLYKVAT